MLRNSLPSRRKRWSTQNLVSWCCIGLTAYFVYHTVVGSYGLEARSRLIQRTALLHRELIALEAVRTQLEHNVALLSATKPDLDIVDEYARNVLGMIHPDEVIVITAPKR